MRHKLHNYLHDYYEQIGFLIRLPLHIFHERELFTIKGAIICSCGYVFDGGYATSDCRECYGGWNYKQLLKGSVKT